MMRYMKDTLQWASLRYVYLHMAQKGGWWEAEWREQKEVCFVWSTSLHNFMAVSLFCTAQRSNEERAAILTTCTHAPPISLSLPLPLLPPPAYSSHRVKGTTSRAISGSRTPTVQTLGVIKLRREIEIGNRGRRGGLMSCRNTEGIKNEAAFLFLLFFLLFFGQNFACHST